MNKVREFLKGKKAYITAAIGLLGAVVAWADGQTCLSAGKSERWPCWRRRGQRHK